MLARVLNNFSPLIKLKKSVSPLIYVRNLSCESVQDLMTIENLLDIPKEVAVFKGEEGLFEPCCSFESGSIRVPPGLSKKYATEVATAANQLSKMQHGVVRLRVSLGRKDQVINWYPTAFAVSPKILFTDYQCVPPSTIGYNHRGEKVVYDFVSIHARTERAPDAAKYNEAGTLSLQLVTRTNDIPNPHPIYDPINKQEWTRGRGNADLAVLKISDDCNLSFKTFFYPSAHAETLNHPVAYFGYPQPISPNQLEKVLAVMREKGHKFPNYIEIPPERQIEARREALANTLSDTFCQYNSRVLSVGSVVECGQYVVAVTNPSTTGTSGSPYVELNNPTFVVGNHLGGGQQISPRERPNYNLFMTVDHPEWVVKYVMYVLPSLPREFWPQVRPYINKHRNLLDKLNCITPEVRQVLM